MVIYNVMVAILDAILNLSNCSRVTTCHQAVSENRDPWLPKSTVTQLNTSMQGQPSLLPDYCVSSSDVLAIQIGYNTS